MKFPKLYTDGYQLAVKIFGRTKSYPKHFRPTLGRRLEEAGLDLALRLRVATATSKGGVSPALREASEHLDHIRIMIQISHDLGLLTGAAYGELSERTAEVGAQIGGLIRFREGHGGGHGRS